MLIPPPAPPPREGDEDLIRRIRRRIEDALRKGRPEQILRIAELLGVKID